MVEPRPRVLIVDDTVVYRRILADVMEALPDAEVTGTAPGGRLALARMAQSPVDLVLLDLNMPDMDGLETLRAIRRLHPSTSVVMVSGMNLDAAEITVQALEQGALDFVWKPEGADPEESRRSLEESLRPILRHVKTRMNLRRGSDPGPVPPPRSAPAPLPAPLPAPPGPPPAQPRSAPLPTRIDAIGIGISTGGPNALGDLIPLLPADLPVPILLVQHMPPMFTQSLAEHLDRRSALRVREARDGEPIRPGTVLLAPGGRHMVVRRRQEADGEEGALIIGLNDHPPENSCRPSVDVLFRSMAAQYEGNLLAVVMTGMGSDGCEGVRAMKRKGCRCLTQSEASCVVYGMPFAVDQEGLSDERVPLARLAARITALVGTGRTRP